jgi:hypothetical protein
MPDQNTDAKARLRKLAERLRQGWGETHPVPEQSLETVRGAVRAEWEKEQRETREQSSKRGPTKTPQREPEEPDAER